MRTKLNRLERLSRNVVLSSLLALGGAAAVAQDQTGADPAFCRAQITDPEVALQVDLCAAHLGCAMVIKVHKTCTAVRGFAERLGNSIGQGVKTFFGYRKEIQPEHIWQAMQSENTRRLDEVPEAKARGNSIRDALAKTDLRQTEGRNANANFVTYGEVKDGLLQGWGMVITSTGDMVRGEFNGQKLWGRGEWVSGSVNGPGTRVSGSFIMGSLSGEGAAVSSSGTTLLGSFQSNVLVEGKRTAANGARQEGQFDSRTEQLVEGSKYAADGSLVEKGSFRDGQLHVGERYDKGQVVAIVDRPREARERTQAQQSQELERLAREQAQRNSQAAAQEQQFLDDLSRMNAGQLYARADELAEKSQADRARQVWRALISRYPDHALAEIAAQKLHSPVRAAPPSAPATANPSSPTAGPPRTAQRRLTSCELETANAKTELDRMTAARICAMNNEKPDPTRLAMARNDGPFGPSTGNVCEGEPPRNPAFDAALARIPPSDINQLIRGAVVGIDMHLAALKQCASSSKVEQQIRALQSQRASALTTCRQLASRDNCEQSPFR